MKQVASSSLLLFQSNKNNIEKKQFKFSKMTIKGKKNSKVRIVADRYTHNYWCNIFQRKRVMSEYFSDSAFGSQSDTKIEFVCLWENEELLKKQRFRRIFEYDYDENEIMSSNISFMHDPNNNSNSINSSSNKEKKKKE